MDHVEKATHARTADGLITELRKLEQVARTLTIKSRELRRAHFGPQPESGETGAEKDSPNGFLPQAFGSVFEISGLLNQVNRDLEDLKESHGLPNQPEVRRAIER